MDIFKSYIMNNKEPQYETMPEHYMLCFNDDSGGEFST